MPRYSEGRPNPRGWAPRRMDSVGDGSGDTNAIGDYSDTGLGVTYFQVTADHRELVLSGLAVKIRGPGPMTAEKYGTIGELTNGAALHLRDPQGAVIVDFSAGDPIKNNSGWYDYTTNVQISDFGSGDNFISIAFRLPDPHNNPIYLPAGWSLGFRFNDDMTNGGVNGLIRQSMFVFGRYVRAFG